MRTTEQGWVGKTPQPARGVLNGVKERAVRTPGGSEAGMSAEGEAEQRGRETGAGGEARLEGAWPCQPHRPCRCWPCSKWDAGSRRV